MGPKKQGHEIAEQEERYVRMEKKGRDRACTSNGEECTLMHF